MLVIMLACSSQRLYEESGHEQGRQGVPTTGNDDGWAQDGPCLLMHQIFWAHQHQTSHAGLGQLGRGCVSCQVLRPLGRETSPARPAPGACSQHSAIMSQLR